MSDVPPPTTSQASRSPISVTKSHLTLTISIQRESQLNALNQEVFEAIGEALYQHLDSETCRILVIEGSGGRAFAAGADIAAMESMSPVEAKSFSAAGQMLTKTLESLPQIVIAKVRGYALGGGLELALACDLIVAGHSARFGLPEVNLGLIPAFGGTQRLARRVGLPVALDMILCGKARTLHAQEAYQLGLVSRAVPDDLLDQEIDSICKALLAAGPEAQATAKRLVRRSFEMSLESGLDAEGQGFALCFADGEAQVGIRAFLDKQPSPFV